MSILGEEEQPVKVMKIRPFLVGVCIFVNKCFLCLLKSELRYSYQHKLYLSCLIPFPNGETTPSTKQKEGRKEKREGEREKKKEQADSCQRGEARAWGALSHALRGAECLPRAPHWQVLNLPVLSCGTQL